MDNDNNWCEQLTSIGLNTYSDNHKKIMDELVRRGIPSTYAVLTETAAEAIIQAVAAMIDANNHAILTEIQ